jgi:hypothetical protein
VPQQQGSLVNNNNNNSKRKRHAEDEEVWEATRGKREKEDCDVLVFFHGYVVWKKVGCGLEEPWSEQIWTVAVVRSYSYI